MMRYLPTLAIGIATTTMLVPTGFLFAQDVSQAPTYGMVELSSGFSPDPHVVDIVAGGSNSASNTDSACTGYVADSPDFSLEYSQEQYALSIFAVASIDITIMVNDPGGSWHCNDDSSNLDGTNPGVYFSSPASGRYDIWVGNYNSDAENASAKLYISEQGEDKWRAMAATQGSSAPVIETPIEEPAPATGTIQYGRKL